MIFVKGTSDFTISLQFLRTCRSPLNIIRQNHAAKIQLFFEIAKKFFQKKLRSPRNLKTKDGFFHFCRDVSLLIGIKLSCRTICHLGRQGKQKLLVGVLFL